MPFLSSCSSLFSILLCGKGVGGGCKGGQGSRNPCPHTLTHLTPHPLIHHHSLSPHREGYPCRLYLDVEFDRRANPDLDGEQLMEEVLAAVVRALLEVCMMRGAGWVDP